MSLIGPRLGDISYRPHLVFVGIRRDLEEGRLIAVEASLAGRFLRPRGYAVDRPRSADFLLGKPKLPCCGAVAALISPAPRKCANLAQFLLRGSGGGSLSNLVALRDLRVRKLRSLGGVILSCDSRANSAIC